jgi:hypothetical protein
VVKPKVELTGECSLEECHRCDPDTELEGDNREGLRKEIRVATARKRAAAP